MSISRPHRGKPREMIWARNLHFRRREWREKERWEERRQKGGQRERRQEEKETQAVIG